MPTEIRNRSTYNRCPLCTSSTRRHHHNNRTDIILDKTIKDAQLIKSCNNSQQSQPSKHRHWEAPKVFRLARRATDNTLCNTTTAIHIAYYPEQITQQFKTTQSPPCPVHSNAESSNMTLAVLPGRYWENNE